MDLDIKGWVVTPHCTQLRGFAANTIHLLPIQVIVKMPILFLLLLITRQVFSFYKRKKAIKTKKKKDGFWKALCQQPDKTF